VQALRGLPLPGRLLTVLVSRNFLNSLLTPCFVQLFSGNSWKILFGISMEKDSLFETPKISKFQNLWMNNKARGDEKCNLFAFSSISAENLNF